MKSGEDKGRGRVIRVQIDQLNKAVSRWQWLSSLSHITPAQKVQCHPALSPLTILI